jgi:hypothetical protein
MRIVFMGTPDFAVPCLKALVEEKHDVVLCITKPDMPVGRKQILTAPPVKEYALSKNIDVYQPNSLKNNESIDFIKGYIVKIRGIMNNFPYKPNVDAKEFTALEAICQEDLADIEVTFF